MSTEVQHVVINYTKANLYSASAVEWGEVKRQGKMMPDRVKNVVMTLKPGMNLIEMDTWKLVYKNNKIVRDMVAEGVIVKVRTGQGAAKHSGTRGTELLQMRPRAAKAIIAKTLDVRLLKLWGGKDRRSFITKACNDQIGILKLRLLEGDRSKLGAVDPMEKDTDDRTPLAESQFDDYGLNVTGPDDEEDDDELEDSELEDDDDDVDNAAAESA